MIASVLIANRGEVAIRVSRACALLGMRSVAVYAADDSSSLHVRRADQAMALAGSGPGAYLDIGALVEAARIAGCDAVHPGYGFLSETAAFAEACTAAGLVFVGPSPETLRVFGDKVAARALARSCGVAVPRGSGPVTLDGAQAFLSGLGPGGAVMVKAVAGGGGRGMRVVHDAAGLAAAWALCTAEARAGSGEDALYMEEFLARARHVEVQAVGDGALVATLGDRDCSVQRRHQKLVEIAPADGLSDPLRQAMADAARAMATRARLRGLCTFEFLVGADAAPRFIEANPRLQVEHTVTEEVMGVDLVAAQLRIAGGATLERLELNDRPRGWAIQARVNMETVGESGAIPSGGRIEVYEPPSGPGVRVDGFGYAGYETAPSYDGLLAKLIVRGETLEAAAALARRALGEFRVEGVDTNLGFLRAVLDSPDFCARRIATDWLDANLAGLVAAAPALPRASAAPEPGAPPGQLTLAAPMAGTLVSLDVAPGQALRRGAQAGVIEAMKMQLAIPAPCSGRVGAVLARGGEVVRAGQALAYLEPEDDETADRMEAVRPVPGALRPELAELRARTALTLDAARPDAVARRHAQGGRTARENLATLLDTGSFLEYGALAVAAQRSRRDLAELMRATPADGVVCGIGTVNAGEYGPERASVLVAAYDYTVLAGTQGAMNHRKQDRLFELAARLRRPLVLLAEGGGGRPGDTDMANVSVAGLDLSTFAAFARLSGLVPLVGVAHGRCFAGNAALLGCCDVVIATKSANIGMGGPAMIEGGGLGTFRPEEVGPASVQWPNGVIDVLAEDEAEAAAAARRYLGYFQGANGAWDAADQTALRDAVPPDRKRAFDPRIVIETLADAGSVLELRAGFGLAAVTALIRVGGRPMGLIANDSRHLGGAIDADAGDKLSRFLGLCDAHGLPVLSLCDTPGFMVGPAAERTAQVRRVCRMFLAGANLSVPMFTVVLRRGYGLGAMAMAGGGFHAPVFTVSWPSGEFGGMGLEGAVRLGFRAELAAIDDPAAREAAFQARVRAMLAHGRATSMASLLEIDAAIDPAETRDWVLAGLRALPTPPAREQKRRPFVDSW